MNQLDRTSELDMPCKCGLRSSAWRFRGRPSACLCTGLPKAWIHGCLRGGAAMFQKESAGFLSSQLPLTPPDSIGSCDSPPACPGDPSTLFTKC